MANQRELIKEGGLTVVGRYMDGSKVVGYHLQSNSGQGGQVTKNQLCSLIQKGAVANCTVQMYKGEVLIRGKEGTNINELPIYDVKNGAYKNTGVEIKGKKNTGKLGQFKLVKRVLLSKSLYAVVLLDASETERFISKQQFISLLDSGMVLNVKIQRNNGEVLFRYDNKEEIETIQFTDTPAGKRWLETPEGQAWAAENGFLIIPDNACNFIINNIGKAKYDGNKTLTNCNNACNTYFYIVNNFEGDQIEKAMNAYARKLKPSDKEELKRMASFFAALAKSKD